MSASDMTAQEALDDLLQDGGHKDVELFDILKRLGWREPSTSDDLGYEAGYRDGERSNAADWQIALDGLLPDDVEAQPTQLAAWIERIQAEQEPADEHDGPLTLTFSPEGFTGVDE